VHANLSDFANKKRLLYKVVFKFHLNRVDEMINTWFYKLKYIMKTKFIITLTTTLIVLTTITSAQVINQWKIDQPTGSWEDAQKWKLHHEPRPTERIQFRAEQSKIIINKKVKLNEGIQLYGRQLSLHGTGGIDLINPLIHNRTIEIPAACDKNSTLILNDQISINARILLSGKSYGTSITTGNLILKDQSQVIGALCVGKDGTGVGTVVINDQALFHITEIDFKTEIENRGRVDLHVISGTLWITLTKKSASTFLDDRSQKILIGKQGTLIIQSPQSTEEKSALIRTLIRKHRIITYPNTTLDIPIISGDKITIRTTSYIPEKNTPSLINDKEKENDTAKKENLSLTKNLIYVTIFIATLLLLFLPKKLINTKNNED